MKKSGLLFTASLVCLAALLYLAATGQATTYSVNEMVSGVYFGGLSQQNNSTQVTVSWETSPVTMHGVFVNTGCPPTALANTMVYLETKYPTIYGTNLVPSWQPNPENDPTIKASNTAALVTTALTLGDPLGPNYLQWNSSGVTFSNFYTGTQSYINSQAPNQTNYAFANSTSLTWNFLYNALLQDKALIIHWTQVSDNSHKHYMSVTGIYWDDATNTGTISYVDPKDGKPYTEPLWLNSGYLYMSYYNPNYNWTNGTQTVKVDWAMEMAPVPLPSTLLLLGSGLLGLAGVGRRFRRG